MSHPHAPRRGTLQFWPRVRATREVARIRTWAISKEAKPLGFIGYKAGMCHVMVTDNRPKSLSKGEEISYPASIIECPPMKVMAINYYKNKKIVKTLFSQNPDKELGRVITLPKKTKDEAREFDDLRLVVHTQPKLTGIGSKKPKISELALGGKKEEKEVYAKEKLGKEILIEEVFKEGVLIDVHAVTKGKGFQGPVKRHGIMLRHHKSEKARRANIRGPGGGPKMWTVPHAAKMGYNQRTDYSKLLVKVGKDAKQVTPSGGITKYGIVKNSYIILKGSIPGSKKRCVMLTNAIRPTPGLPKEAPAVRDIIV